MKKHIMFITLLLISGCITTDKSHEIIETGSSPKDIQKMVDTQKGSVQIIDTEASTIIKTTKNDTVLDSAKTIIKENQRISVTADALSSEAKGKNNLLMAYKQLQIDHKKLEDEKNSGFRKFFIWLKIIGALVIPIGIFLGIKLDPMFYWLSVGGVVVIILSFVVTFIEKHWGWVVGAMLICAIITAIRQYVVQDNATFEAVKVGEILKDKVKEVDNDYVKELFGDGTKPGIIQQNNVTKKIITNQRIKVLKEAKSTIEKI